MIMVVVGMAVMAVVVARVVEIVLMAVVIEHSSYYTVPKLGHVKCWNRSATACPL